MKTRELTSFALDYAVSWADGNKPVRCEHRGQVWFVLGEPSFGHADTHIPAYLITRAGGDLIDREGIDIVRCNDLYFPSGNEHGETYEAYWKATLGELKVYGPTAMEAGLRCFVVSKLGEEIDIPKDLQWA